MHRSMKLLAVALLSLGSLPALHCAAEAADRQLVMFSAIGCTYCRLFDREVGGAYNGSPTGHAAPLQRVDVLGQGTGGYSLKSDITILPTFVMFERGREVARIGGYPGRENFYQLVDAMIAQGR